MRNNNPLRKTVAGTPSPLWIEEQLEGMTRDEMVKAFHSQGHVPTDTISTGTLAKLLAWRVGVGMYPPAVLMAPTTSLEPIDEREIALAAELFLLIQDRGANRAFVALSNALQQADSTVQFGFEQYMRMVNGTID